MGYKYFRNGHKNNNRYVTAIVKLPFFFLKFRGIRYTKISVFEDYIKREYPNAKHVNYYLQGDRSFLCQTKLNNNAKDHN